MRNRLDNILLGLLWLLAATLGASFWFNTKYGFNIFSAPHWQYLAYLQASQSPVAPSFYISLGVCVFVTIFGLYFLIQPKFRRIVIPTTKQQTQPDPMPAAPQKSDAPEIVTPAAPTPEQPAAPTHPAAPAVPARPTPPRPPHLTLPTANSYAAAPMPITTDATSNNNDAANRALGEIFEQNGYTVKKNPYINGWQPNLVAIGTNEVMWIGGVGATTTQVKNAINKLQQVFSDTLDDIQIGVNGFAINAPDAQTAEFNDILLFDDIDDLRTYMSAHQNTPPDTEEQENFDAYSEYIDTVIGYIGKL